MRVVYPGNAYGGYVPFYSDFHTLALLLNICSSVEFYTRV
jgi:hypothetical protein